ncbi:MAG: FAD/NAD(P)-binding protein [Chloroflexi bacterium]|nr:FAD/NAD(P)-binding protein [Chloroflexota bacterium]
MTSPLLPYEAVIKDIRQETYDTATYTFAFKDPAAHAEYSFRPGQFNMLTILGVGEAAVSLSSDSGRRDCFQHTVRAVGSVTGSLARRKVGDVVGLRGPYGRGWPLEAAGDRDVLIVAGGIGLAPLRPVIEHVLRSRSAYGRLLLLYGARTPRDLCFTGDFERWHQGKDLEFHVTVDRIDGQPWEQNVGVVPLLLDKVKLSPVNTVALICGPEVMMKFTVIDLAKRGVPGDNIFVSMERNMKCAVAQCGHCFFGPKFVCKDGSVFSYPEIEQLWGKGV